MPKEREHDQQLHEPQGAVGLADVLSTSPTARNDGGSTVRPSRVWLWLSSAAALLAAAGSLVGLLAADLIYGHETATLADAAAAQDAVNLVLVAPLLVILGLRAWQGSLVGYLMWLGLLTFTAYNYAIYAFSIQFGPLFLLWVTVLGLSVFALAGGLATVDPAIVKCRFDGRALPLTGWLLIVVATVFALLWLSEIVPALLAGDPPRTATDWQIPTNPVHVLDLAFFLPAVVISGVMLLRRHPGGYATAPGQLVFLSLTCLPILVTPLIADARGHEAGWAVMLPVGLVFVTTLAALWRTLRGIPGRPRPQQ